MRCADEGSGRHRGAEYAQLRYLYQSTLKTPRRRLWLATLALAGLALAATLALRHYSRPEQVAQLARDLVRERLGLTLDFAGAPQLGLWPGLHLVLEQPRLSAAQAAPLLAAQRLDLALSWASLGGGTLQVERLDLLQPRLDLDALIAWREAGPESAVPALQLGLQIRDGSLVRGGQVLASGVDLQGEFDLPAWESWWRGLDGASRVDALLPPGALRLDVARMDIGTTRLEGVHLVAEAP